MGTRARIPAAGLAMAMLLILASGCSDHGTEPQIVPTPEPVSLASDLQPIIDRECLSCHGSRGTAGLNLNPGVVWTNLVGVEANNYPRRLRVDPGNPATSIFLLKLEGATNVGARMPLGGQLPAGDIEQFRLWIEQGAPDN